MAKLYMMHGYIGSGKTTFAKQHSQNTGAIHFSVDDWMQQLYGKMPDTDMYQAYETRIKHLMHDLARTLLEQGTDVIFDFGYWKLSERQADIQFAHSCQAEPILYVCQAPLDIMRARAIARTERDEEDQVMIDGHAFDNLYAYFEPVTEDEPHKIIETI